jgi:hypothetical protein
MASISQRTPLSAQLTHVSPVERGLLALPLLGGVVFGLIPLFAPQLLAMLAGTPGNDPYIYWLAGAATFGYAVVLALGLRQAAWAPLRLIVAAVLAFNLASIYACGLTIAGGGAQPIVYLILVTSIGFVTLCAPLLRRHAGAAGAPDTAPWVVCFCGSRHCWRQRLGYCRCSRRSCLATRLASRQQMSSCIGRPAPLRLATR